MSYRRNYKWVCFKRRMRRHMDDIKKKFCRHEWQRSMFQRLTYEHVHSEYCPKCDSYREVPDEL